MACLKNIGWLLHRMSLLLRYCICLWLDSTLEKAMHPTPVLLPGKSHGRRSLVGCSPWGLEESHATEWLPFHFSLSCIGEGNGNLLQCSCLENPRDGGALWAAVYGVTQSRTRLKWLSSSSRLNLRLLGGNMLEMASVLVRASHQGGTWCQSVTLLMMTLLLDNTHRNL